MDDSFEREKWEVERAFREREIAIKEREQQSQEADLALKKAEHEVAHWKSPLVVAIFAASIAAIGNAILAYENAKSQTRLEAQKAEQARILEMIKTGSPDKAAENLKFLLKTGLISDPAIRSELAKFLDSRQPGTGPSLPSVSSAKEGTELVAKFEGTALKPYTDTLGQSYIGSGHRLTEYELSSGQIVIGDQPINFRSGITPAQAKQLLEQDIEPYRKKVNEFVTVPLTKNQRDALASFIFDLGPGALKQSQLLVKLNAGKYDEVPNEMRKFVKMAGRVIPAKVKRREAEVALWNKQ